MINDILEFLDTNQFHAGFAFHWLVEKRAKTVIFSALRWLNFIGKNEF